jgi:hypothetical protein
VRNMCADLDRKAVTEHTKGLHSLLDAVAVLAGRLGALVGKNR